MTADALFMERFPGLALLSLAWEEKQPGEEKLPEIQLGGAELLYFYGLGTGSLYFQVKHWLKEKKERELVFLEDEPGIIAAFLKEPHALEILADPQVRIELLSKGKARGRELDALAARYPEQNLAIASLPSYKGSRFRALRMKLLRKTALAHALHMDRLHGDQPFENFVKNLSYLSHSFYANRLKNRFAGVPAVVCGAGPSLGRSIEVLRDLEKKALLIAGGSTLAALSSQGVLPHFGMAIDPNLEEYRRFKNSFAFETPLLYSTRVFPAVFHTCNGPFGYMRSGIGGAMELWIEEELGLADPLLGEFLSPESISVTSICLAWAQFLGCNPILLNGIDLAYTDNKRYAQGVDQEAEEEGTPLGQESLPAADRIVRRKDIRGKTVDTAVRWVMESASISHFAKSHPEIRFINTTEGGIGFKGIENRSLTEVAADWPDIEPDLRAQVQEAVADAQMPLGTAEKILQKKREFQESLQRAIGCLQILAGERKGSLALAEIELKEEIAIACLFYDGHAVVEQAIGRLWRAWMPDESLVEKEARLRQFTQEKWKKWLSLALRYRDVLIKNF